VPGFTEEILSMVAILGLLGAAMAAPVSRQFEFMECGGAAICGVVALETGLGPDFYNHSRVGVHGLWPEVGSYGSSQCVKPTGSLADPTKVYACYQGQETSSHQLDFETHEWEKHGQCAGVKDVDDFFDQICRISAPPLKVMNKTRTAGKSDLDAYVDDLKAAGYPVFGTDAVHSQVLLSACAGNDRYWVIANVSEFGTKCGGGSPAPAPGPAPPPSPTPSPSSRKCVDNQHGPACSSDSDCGYPNCVRCAHSGFCTNVPLNATS